MQVFKLVNGGFVDKVIAFDTLPERLLKSISTRTPEGMPKAWRRRLEEVGSLREVYSTQTEVLVDRTLKIIKTPAGVEACFYVLNYQELNADKEKWQEIAAYVRRVVDTKFRLKDKLEDMASSLAPNCQSEITLDPEDIPVIPIPSEEQEEQPTVAVPVETLMTPTGDSVIQPKKRGRPKKVSVEA